jgi:hypothetical protein
VGNATHTLLSPLSTSVYTGPGVWSEVVPPVPIPNTAVKRLSVDDTGGAAFWENRSMPGSSLHDAIDSVAHS